MSVKIAWKLYSTLDKKWLQQAHVGGLTSAYWRKEGQQTPVEGLTDAYCKSVSGVKRFRNFISSHLLLKIEQTSIKWVPKLSLSIIHLFRHSRTRFALRRNRFTRCKERGDVELSGIRQSELWVIIFIFVIWLYKLR